MRRRRLRCPPHSCGHMMRCSPHSCRHMMQCSHVTVYSTQASVSTSLLYRYLNAIYGTGHRICGRYVTGHKTRFRACRAWDTIYGTGHRILVIGHRTQVTGHRVLYSIHTVHRMQYTGHHRAQDAVRRAPCCISSTYGVDHFSCFRLQSLSDHGLEHLSVCMHADAHKHHACTVQHTPGIACTVQHTPGIAVHF